jgi:hypothetical protein
VSLLVVYQLGSSGLAFLPVFIFNSPLFLTTLFDFVSDLFILSIASILGQTSE